MLGTTYVGQTNNATAYWENLTTGNISRWDVGDRWRVSIRGAKPNTPIYVNATFRSYAPARAGLQDIAASIWTGQPTDGSLAVGTTDSNGDATLSGTFNRDQAGEWNVFFNAGDLIWNGANISNFIVRDIDGSIPTATPLVPTGQATSELASNYAPTNPGQYTIQSLFDMATKPLEQARQTVNQTGGNNQTSVLQLPDLTNVGASIKSMGFDIKTIALVGGGLLLAYMVLGKK